MNIRHAAEKDLPRILEIYAFARTFMAKTGNPTQWGTSHPEKEILLDDIEKEHLFVIEDEDVIHGAFAFIIGEDSTYRVIDDGAWLSDDTYGTIHRTASDGQTKGILGECIAFCAAKISNLRIDTHPANEIMQHLIEKHGFQKCGVIYAYDGTPRIAYQRVIE